MKTRNATVLVVLAGVLGGGLVALQLASRPRAPEPPAGAQPPALPIAQATAPAPPSRPQRARPAVTASEPGGGTIDGRVIHGMTHEGVANAELTLVGDAGVSTFRTSSDGTFELTPAASGSFVLTSITAHGFLPYSSRTRVTLSRGQSVHGVTLKLFPAIDYDGTVVDARGAPVPEARVRVLGPPGEPVLESPPEWKTGRDGRFTFQAADGAVLEANRGAARGWGHVDRTVLIMKKLTIQLGHAPPRDATITGRVRDAAGAPVAEALVRAAPSEYYTTAPTVVATTGADGRFALAGVERAPYELSVEAADHLRLVRSEVPGGSRDLELVLDAGLPLSGQVVDKRGEPVTSFTLVVQQHVDLARAPVATQSLIDPQGRFALRVARGDYDLIASTPDHKRVAVRAAAGATDVRIVIDSIAIVRGRVIASDDGSPIADAFVGLAPARRTLKSPLVQPWTATGGDGSFQLDGVASGAVAIEVRARGYATKLEELPAVPDGEARGPLTIAMLPGAPTPEALRRGGNGSGEVIGIGVQIEPAVDERSESGGTRSIDALRVVHVMPGSGALDAGVSVGDLIVEIDGVPVGKLGVNAAVANIRGPVGTSVTLTLRRGGHNARRSVERRPIRS
jgi:hypothetical protein